MDARNFSISPLYDFIETKHIDYRDGDIIKNFEFIFYKDTTKLIIKHSQANYDIDKYFEMIDTKITNFHNITERIIKTLGEPKMIIFDTYWTERLLPIIINFNYSEKIKEKVLNFLKNVYSFELKIVTNLRIELKTHHTNFE